MENKGIGMAIDIRQALGILKKWKWLILVITVLTGSAAWVVNFYVLKPVYESKVSVVIIKAQEDPGDQEYDNNDIVMYQNLIKTYAQIATSRTVANKAEDRLRASNVWTGALYGQLTVQPQEGTQIIDFRVRDASPVMVRDKLNAFADAFVDEVTGIFPNGSVHIIDAAVAPQKPVSPKKKFNIFMSTLVGLILSMGGAVLLEMLDNTLKSEEDIENLLGIPVLASVPVKE